MNQAEKIAGAPGLVSRFSTPFTPLYKRWNYVEKPPLPATFGHVRRAFHAGMLARRHVAAS